MPATSLSALHTFEAKSRAKLYHRTSLIYKYLFNDTLWFLSFCVNKSDKRYCKKATPIEPLQAHLKIGCIPAQLGHSKCTLGIHRWHQVTLMWDITGGTGFCNACCKINRRNPLLRHGWLQWWSKRFPCLLSGFIEGFMMLYALSCRNKLVTTSSVSKPIICHIPHMQKAHTIPFVAFSCSYCSAARSCRHCKAANLRMTLRPSVVSLCSAQYIHLQYALACSYIQILYM